MRRSLFPTLALLISAGCQGGSDSPQVRTIAPAPVAAPTESSRSTLEKRLTGTDEAERLGAAVILLTRTDSEARRIVRQYLTDSRAESAQSALIEALRIRPEAEYAPMVVDALSSPGRLCREAASGTLPYYDASVTVPLLLSHLESKEPDADTSRRIIAALAASRDQHAVEALIGLLEKPALSDAASQALREITGASIERIEDWQKWWQQSRSPDQVAWLRRELEQQERATNDLRKELEEERKRNDITAEEVATFLVSVLQQRDPETGATLLIGALQMPYEKVRVYAAGELGRMKAADAIQALSGLALVDTRPTVRIAATNALVQIDAVKVSPTLEKVLQDADPTVAAVAASGLGKAGVESGVSPLLLALLHKSPVVRGAAADALGRIGDKRAARPLLRLLGSDEVIEVRQQAARALGLLKDAQAVPELVRTLDSIEPSLRIFAIDALGEIGDASVLDRLEKLLLGSDNIGVRESSAVALGKIGDARALPVLRRALKQGDERLPQLAFGAIVNICRPNPKLLSETADALVTDSEHARAAQLIELLLETTIDKPELADMIQPARRNLSRCYLAQEQWAKALKLLEDFNRANPDAPDVIEDYARALAGSEKYTEAFRQYVRLAQLTRKEAGYWPEQVALLQNMVAKKRCEQALELIREAERATPAPPEAVGAQLKELKNACRLQVLETAAAGADGTEKLVKYLGSEEAVEREAAAAKLKERGADAFGALVNGLVDPNVRVRRGSVELLRQLSGKNFDYDPEALPEVRARNVELWREWLKTTVKPPETTTEPKTE